MLKTKKAFTLVEMLIVVVIIGILAAALIPRLT
jgi:prepilin-type N-terminal cleavage/methylation domain-containing protein